MKSGLRSRAVGAVAAIVGAFGLAGPAAAQSTLEQLNESDVWICKGIPVDYAGEEVALGYIVRVGQGGEALVYEVTRINLFGDLYTLEVQYSARASRGSDDAITVVTNGSSVKRKDTLPGGYEWGAVGGARVTLTARMARLGVYTLSGESVDGFGKTRITCNSK